MAGHWSSLELGHGLLRASGDCTDSMGRILTSGEVQWGGWGEPIEPAMGQCDGGRRCAARAVLGARTRGEWGRDECGEVGVSPRPLIGGRGGVEASSGEGIGRRWQ
jgi:hypothetical protein